MAVEEIQLENTRKKSVVGPITEKAVEQTNQEGSSKENNKYVVEVLEERENSEKS